MKDLRDEFGMAIIVIAHNMGVVSETADRVLVMYAGRIVEEARSRGCSTTRCSLYVRPAGMRSLARAGPRAPVGDPGHAARPGAPLRRLPFLARWRCAVPACSAAVPPLATFDPGHTAACIRIAELTRRSWSRPRAPDQAFPGGRRQPAAPGRHRHWPNVRNSPATLSSRPPEPGLLRPRRRVQ